MIKCTFRTQTSILLTVLLFYTACSGQINTDLPKTGHPKLIKNHFSDEYQALSDNIHCGLQDKAGKLWFGTTGDGVYQFDGKLFINFTTKEGLSSNTVWSILEDRAGYIWFGTADGICRYDGKHMSKIPITVFNGNNLQTISTSNSNASLTNEVWSIMQDKSGVIWFGTSEGVFCYKENFFTRFLDNESIINKGHLELKMIQCMLEDKSGNIWFGSGLGQLEGVCCFDGKTITNYKPGGENWMRHMFEDKEGKIWMAGRHYGNFLYDGKTFTNFTENVGVGNSILADKAGNIWFTGEENDKLESVDGIWRYDGNTFKNFTTNEGLGKYFVWSVTEDRNGNIWLGTRNTELYRYDGKTFTSFSE